MLSHLPNTLLNSNPHLLIVLLEGVGGAVVLFEVVGVDGATIPFDGVVELADEDVGVGVCGATILFEGVGVGVCGATILFEGVGVCGATILFEGVGELAEDDVGVVGGLVLFEGVVDSEAPTSSS